MKLDEKLHKQMLLKGLNGQRLARLSQVSDSEISRILAGKSLPGLENAYRLARAVGVSLDYLADDSLESDPAKATSDVTTEPERAILKVVRDLGTREAAQLLEMARFMGYDAAMRRLLGAVMPVIEVAPSESRATARENVGARSSA
jgi:transcriptional regulator with XRE-family HTH domain